MPVTTIASPDDDGMTPAQRRQEAKRLERAQQDVPAGDAGESPKTEAVPLAVMLAQGNSVEIGGKEYEVAAFPVSKLGLAGKLIAQCPELMISAALAASEDGEIGAQKTYETLNRLAKQTQPDAAELSPALIAYAFNTVAMGVTEEEAAAMTPLAVLALSRKHPDVTEADIEGDLDVPAFIVLLCRIFAQNKMLRARF